MSDLTPEELTRLEELRAAATPGPWVATSGGVARDDGDGRGSFVIAMLPDATYIAAFDPDTSGRLLAQVAAAEQEVAALKALVERVREYGEHFPECAMRQTNAGWNTTCDCGFGEVAADVSAALADPPDRVGGLTEIPLYADPPAEVKYTTCKICGGRLQATAPLDLDNVELDADGIIRGYTVDHNPLDNGYFDQVDIYCENDHQWRPDA